MAFLRYITGMTNTNTPPPDDRTPAAASCGAPVHIVFVRPGARALYTQDRADFLPRPPAVRGGFPGGGCGAPPAGGLGRAPRLCVPTGLSVQPQQPGLAGFVYSRSGLGARDGLAVAQGVGVIDPDYTGEILVALLNTSGEERRLTRGERMAQLIFQPYVRPLWQEVPELAATGRGAGGFGHTGR